jgi:hypothetical protein
MVSILIIPLEETCACSTPVVSVAQEAEAQEARHSQGQKLRRPGQLCVRDPVHMVPIME